jgi:hypothetical protein
MPTRVPAGRPKRGRRFARAFGVAGEAGGGRVLAPYAAFRVLRGPVILPGYEWCKPEADVQAGHGEPVERHRNEGARRE